MSQPLPPNLELNYSARWWTLTSSVRQLVEAFSRLIVDNKEFADQVAMTSHELIENAVKYARDPESCLHFRLQMIGGALQLRVTNPSLLDNIEVLKREFAYINDGDPLEIYILKMQSDIYSDTSRLGLARIRYEADACLTLRVEGDLVTMEATFELPEKLETHAEIEQTTHS